MDTTDHDGISKAPAVEPAGGEPFNPLTGDLNDLVLTHQHCWLWPQITHEIDRLAGIAEDARTFLGPLVNAGTPDWAQQAAIGIARSNIAIHQYAERYGNYADVARNLWTARIPGAPPTLTDAQIYALLAIHEARMAAEIYCEIADGLEEEMANASIGHGDEDEIGWLRGELAGWERRRWHAAAHQTGTAEKFLLLANFTAHAPAPEAQKRAEAQIAKLQKRAQAAEAAVQPYHGGRKKGAISNFTRALIWITRRSRSRDLDAFLGDMEEYVDEDVEGIRFQSVEYGRLYYLDVYTQNERSISLDSLKRKLQELPGV